MVDSNKGVWLVMWLPKKQDYRLNGVNYDTSHLGGYSIYIWLNKEPPISLLRLNKSTISLCTHTGQVLHIECNAQNTYKPHTDMAHSSFRISFYHDTPVKAVK